jgi:hypothetical protein
MSETIEFEHAHREETDGSKTVIIKFPSNPELENRTEAAVFEATDGTVIHHIGDMPHRVDGPACIYPIMPLPDGSPSVDYIVNGKYHRIDGPSLIRPHGTSWWRQGRRHRLTGPALIDNKKGVVEWWVNGKKIDNVAEILEKHELNPDTYETWTEAEQILVRLALT